MNDKSQGSIAKYLSYDGLLYSIYSLNLLVKEFLKSK